jgi:Tyrosine phosphatase family
MEATSARIAAWIDGAINLTDFGGYLTEDGGRVREGLLFRSGATHGIGSAGVAQLAEALGMETRPDTMRALFGRIREAHADVHCLLSDAGVSDDVTDRLRGALLHAS